MKTANLPDFNYYRFGLRVSVAAIVWCLVLAALPALGEQNQSAAQTTSNPPATQSDPHTSARGLPNNAVEIGGGFGSYTGGLGAANGQSFRLSLSKPRAYRWVLDFGRQYRFGESSVGGGITYFRSLPRDTTLSVGAGTGTGYLAPRYNLGVGLTKSLFGVLSSVNYQRTQSKAENSSDSLGLGFIRYQAHWIASASTRLDVGHPGNSMSPGFGLGLTYYVYRKTYVGMGFDFGRVSYMLVGAGQTLINYTAKGYSVSFSQWISDRRGFNLRFNYGDTSFYKAWGVTLSLFQEW